MSSLQAGIELAAQTVEALAVVLMVVFILAGTAPRRDDSARGPWRRDVRRLVFAAPLRARQEMVQP